MDKKFLNKLNDKIVALRRQASELDRNITSLAQQSTSTRDLFLRVLGRIDALVEIFEEEEKAAVKIVKTKKAND